MIERKIAELGGVKDSTRRLTTTGRLSGLYTTKFRYDSLKQTYDPIRSSPTFTKSAWNVSNA